MTTLGENVKFLREKKGLTYEAVGAAVGTDGQNIFNMEKRKSKVSRFAPALAKLFGVDLDDLMQVDMAAQQPVKTEHHQGKILIAAEDVIRLLHLYSQLDTARRSQAMILIEGL